MAFQTDAFQNDAFQITYIIARTGGIIIQWYPNFYQSYHSIDEAFVWTGTYTKPPIISNYPYKGTLEATRKYKATLEAKH